MTELNEKVLRQRYLDARTASDIAYRATCRALTEWISGSPLEFDPLTRDAIAMLSAPNPIAEKAAFVEKHYTALRDLPKPREERKRFIIRAAAVAVVCGALGFAAGVLL